MTIPVTPSLVPPSPAAPDATAACLAACTAAAAAAAAVLDQTETVRALVVAFARAVEDADDLAARAGRRETDMNTLQAIKGLGARAHPSALAVTRTLRQALSDAEDVLRRLQFDYEELRALAALRPGTTATRLAPAGASPQLNTTGPGLPLEAVAMLARVTLPDLLRQAHDHPLSPASQAAQAAQRQGAASTP